VRAFFDFVHRVENESSSRKRSGIPQSHTRTAKQKRIRRTVEKRRSLGHYKYDDEKTIATTLRLIVRAAAGDDRQNVSYGMSRGLTSKRRSGLAIATITIPSRVRYGVGGGPQKRETINIRRRAHVVGGYDRRRVLLSRRPVLIENVFFACAANGLLFIIIVIIIVFTIVRHDSVDIENGSRR